MSSQHSGAPEVANPVNGQALTLRHGTNAASAPGVRGFPVHRVHVSEAAVPGLYPAQIHQRPNVTEAVAFHENLHKQWLSYQQNLKDYLACFHPTITGSVGPDFSLPPPRSPEDAVRQEKLYGQWCAYMQNYYAFLSHLEQIRNLEHRKSSSQGNSGPPLEGCTERTGVPHFVFSNMDLNLLERIPGIYDLAKEMGFSV